MVIRRELYSGGIDCNVRVWDPSRGKDQEPGAASDTQEPVTALGASVRKHVHSALTEGLKFSKHIGRQMVHWKRRFTCPSVQKIRNIYVGSGWISDTLKWHTHTVHIRRPEERVGCGRNGVRMVASCQRKVLLNLFK